MSEKNDGMYFRVTHFRIRFADAKLEPGWDYYDLNPDDAQDKTSEEETRGTDGPMATGDDRPEGLRRKRLGKARELQLRSGHE